MGPGGEKTRGGLRPSAVEQDSGESRDTGRFAIARTQGEDFSRLGNNSNNDGGVAGDEAEERAIERERERESACVSSFPRAESASCREKVHPSTGEDRGPAWRGGSSVVTRSASKVEGPSANT